MASRNVETYRAGHEAFNRRDFAAMTRHYADGIAWTDHRTGADVPDAPGVQDDFLAGWSGASTDIRITGARYLDAGRHGRLHLHRGRHARTGRSDRSPRPASEFALPLCEMWHFDSNGRVVGGDLYYDQVSLLTQLGLMPQPSAA